MSDLANVGIDIDRIHPDIVRFFDDTASLDLLVRSRWSFPFSIVFVLFRWVMRSIGQFYLPPHNGDGSRIKTTAFAIDPYKDGRADVRAILRTYNDDDDDKAVMQVVLYATHENAETSDRYMSAAFPLPGGASVTGILRVDSNSSEDPDGRGYGIALTSEARLLPDGSMDDAAVWLDIGPFIFRAPLGECIELWTPKMPGAPKLDLDRFPGTTIVGTHVQKIFGIRFATHDYWFRPVPAPAPESNRGARPKT